MTVWVHGIRFSFLVFKLKNEWPLSYIFVFLRTIVPSWFWSLHDLVLSRLAELPSYFQSVIV